MRVVGRLVESVAITHPRAVRRHLEGADDLAGRLTGRKFESAARRGKFLWLTLDDPEIALVVHLGMSGQMLVRPGGTPLEKHTHIRVALGDGTELRFVDQRTFGGWVLAPMIEVDATAVPESVAHIARDPLDPHFDRESVVAHVRRKHSEIKRILLDQRVVSGIGNIYADEALWRAGIHGGRSGAGLSAAAVGRLLSEVGAVMNEALDAGGTSFDSLYVDVNGRSGYFERSLAVYGRENEPCGRCGAAIVRERFMNRSSYSCPRCQPRSRRR